MGGMEPGIRAASLPPEKCRTPRAEDKGHGDIYVLAGNCVPRADYRSRKNGPATRRMTCSVVLPRTISTSAA